MLEFLIAQPWAWHNAGEPWSYSENEEIRRYEVRAGDHWLTEKAERSERFSHPWDSGKDILLSYEFKVEAGAANTAQWVLIGQFHATADPGEKDWSPPLSVELEGELMRIGIRSSDERITTSNPEMEILWRDTQPLQRNVWYQMEMRIRFSTKGDGLMQVRRNGNLIIDRPVSVGYLDDEGPYWKEGIYRSAAPEELAVQYRNLSIGYAPG